MKFLTSLTYAAALAMTANSLSIRDIGDEILSLAQSLQDSTSTASSSTASTSTSSSSTDSTTIEIHDSATDSTVVETQTTYHVSDTTCEARNHAFRTMEMGGIFYLPGNTTEVEYLHTKISEELCHMCEQRFSEFYNCLHPFQGMPFHREPCMCVKENFPTVNCPEDTPIIPPVDDTPVSTPPIKAQIFSVICAWCAAAQTDTSGPQEDWLTGDAKVEDDQVCRNEHGHQYPMYKKACDIHSIDKEETFIFYQDLETFEEPGKPLQNIFYIQNQAYQTVCNESSWLGYDENPTYCEKECDNFGADPFCAGWDDHFGRTDVLTADSANKKKFQLDYQTEARDGMEDCYYIIMKSYAASGTCMYANPYMITFVSPGTTAEEVYEDFFMIPVVEPTSNYRLSLWRSAAIGIPNSGFSQGLDLCLRLEIQKRANVL